MVKIETENANVDFLPWLVALWYVGEKRNVAALAVSEILKALPVKSKAASVVKCRSIKSFAN